MRLAGASDFGWTTDGCSDQEIINEPEFAIRRQCRSRAEPAKQAAFADTAVRGSDRCHLRFDRL
jgi:hypothetical protein